MELCNSKDSSDISELYSLSEFHNEKCIIYERDINYLFHNIKDVETTLNNKINDIDYVTNFIIIILFIFVIILSISQ